MTTEELFRKLQEEIPLTRHLGFQIVAAGPHEVRLRASLAENSNHKGTAFGGSLYTLAVLSAYSVVYLGVDREGLQTNNIVIQKGEMKYLQPVTADFDLVCEFPREQYRKFFQSLTRWKKVRDLLKVQVICQGRVCARLEGTFVVQL